MKYIKIEKDNLLNGPGIRTVLWLSGCNHKCPKCHNPETWNSLTGFEFDDLAKKELFDNLSKDYSAGLTLTGGDPLFPENRNDLLELLKEIKSKFPNKTIWCWSGYTIETLIPNFENNESTEYQILKNIDVLVDGKFDYNIREQDLLKPDHLNILKYRGSSNQRIINVQKTIIEKKVNIYGKSKL